jgi:hypothetical protein
MGVSTHQLSLSHSDSDEPLAVADFDADFDPDFESYTLSKGCPHHSLRNSHSSSNPKAATHSQTASAQQPEASPALSDPAAL